MKVNLFALAKLAKVHEYYTEHTYSKVSHVKAVLKSRIQILY